MRRTITAEEKARLLAAFIDWLSDEKDVYSEDELLEQYRDALNEEPVKIGSLEYDAAWVLEQVDETAFRCGFADFIGEYWELLPGGFYSEYTDDTQWSSFVDECCSACPVCGYYYMNDEITNESGEFACPDCSRDACDGCGEFVSRDDLEPSDPDDGHSERFCSDCRA